jgi:hypothetical protein
MGEFERKLVRMNLLDETDSRWAKGTRAETLFANSVTRRQLLLFVVGTENETVGTVGIVNATTAEAQDGASHGLDRRVASKNNKITPREGITVLVLDGLQELESIIQVGVVVPVELRVKTDSTAVAPAATVRLTVGSGTMPGETNHETSIVGRFKVRGEERLRVGKKGRDVLSDFGISTFRNNTPVAFAHAELAAMMAVDTSIHHTSFLGLLLLLEEWTARSLSSGRQCQKTGDHSSAKRRTRDAPKDWVRPRLAPITKPWISLLTLHLRFKLEMHLHLMRD